MTRLYVAVTSACGQTAEELVGPFRDLGVGVKIGLELFVRSGPRLVREISDMGVPVFLDLKFHDIPYTVSGAVRSAAELGAEVTNIHASGGMEMMRAAALAAAGQVEVIAVTLLTSLEKSDLALMGSRSDPLDLVAEMASAVKTAGLSGVVCSPRETAAVRSAAGEGFLIFNPGIRPHGASSDDQKRTATPAEAIAAGATALVVGRPITRAADPRSAAAEIQREIEDALPAD